MGGQYIPPYYQNWFALARFPELPANVIAFSSRLMIEREWRHGQALRLLLRELYRHGREKGIWLDFIHCAPALVSLYEALGYRRVLDRIVETDVGQHVPMALVADDLPHLNRVRSPFLREAKALPSNAEHHDWFANRFPQYAMPASCRLIGEPAFLNYLGQQLTVEEVKLFRKIPAADVAKFLVNATVLNVSAGDTIVKAGELGSEIFVLLEGAAEVRIPQASSYVVMRTMGKGEVFGEIGQLMGGRRSADVVAMGNCRILSLPPDFLEHLIETNPSLGGRVALNLSAILAERLATVPNTITIENYVACP